MNSKLTKVIQLAPAEKYGIQDLKTVISALFEIREQIHDLITNWSIPKAIQVAFELVEYKTVLPKFQQAWLQLKDLSTSESQEVAAHIKLNFDIANDDLEAKIETGIDLIPKTYIHIKESVLLVQEWGDFFKGFKPASEIQTSKKAA